MRGWGAGGVRRRNAGEGNQWKNRETEGADKLGNAWNRPRLMKKMQCRCGGKANGKSRWGKKYTGKEAKTTRKHTKHTKHWQDTSGYKNEEIFHIAIFPFTCLPKESSATSVKFLYIAPFLFRRHTAPHRKQDKIKLFIDLDQQSFTYWLWPVWWRMLQRLPCCVSAAFGSIVCFRFVSLLYYVIRSSILHLVGGWALISSRLLPLTSVSNTRCEGLR